MSESKIRIWYPAVFSRIRSVNQAKIYAVHRTSPWKFREGVSATFMFQLPVVIELPNHKSGEKSQFKQKGRKERKHAGMTSPLKAVTPWAGVSLLVFVPPGGVSMCMLLTDLGQNTWQCCVTQPWPRSSNALQCFLFIFTCRKKEDLQMIVPFLICSG